MSRSVILILYCAYIFLVCLNLFSMYFTNSIISKIINQAFNVNILKFAYFIFVIKFTAVNNN